MVDPTILSSNKPVSRRGDIYGAFHGVLPLVEDSKTEERFANSAVSVDRTVIPALESLHLEKVFFYGIFC